MPSLSHSGSLKESLMCSPRPYRLGFFGRMVLISKYWSENCTAGQRERERERERALLANCPKLSLVQPFLHKCGWMMTSVYAFSV